MNKITRKRPNYMKLFINAYNSKTRFYYFDTDIPNVNLILSGRFSGKKEIIEEKNRLIKELNEKYGKETNAL